MANLAEIQIPFAGSSYAFGKKHHYFEAHGCKKDMAESTYSSRHTLKQPPYKPSNNLASTDEGRLGQTITYAYPIAKSSVSEM